MSIQKAIKGVIICKGKEFKYFVDSSDYEWVKMHKWHLTQNGYAISWIQGKRLRMHHFLIGKPPKGKEVDHINRNRLDNRRSNLRFVSSLQNGQNNNAVGVRQRVNSWEANICVNYQKYFKGGFATKEQALRWRLKIKKKFNGIVK